MSDNNVSYFSRIFLGSFLGLCCAVFSVPVVAANPPVRYDPVTTTYYTTPEFLKKPAGARTYARDVTPLIEHWDDGLRQRMGGGVTIEAQRVRAPFTAYVRATGSALKIAAYRCFTSLRCNAALVAGSYGLDALLDAVDWVIDEGGKIQRLEKYIPDGDLPKGITSSAGISNFAESAWSSTDGPNMIYVASTYNPIHDYTYSWYCQRTGGPYAGDNYPLIGVSSNACYYGSATPLIVSNPVPVSDTDIAEGVENNYEPDPTDWPAVAEFLPINALTYSVDPIPSQKEPPTVSTDYDASGNPTGSIERSREHDFDIRNNGSSNPELEVKTKETVKRYEDGQLVSSTETEQTLEPEESIPPPQQPPVELPEGCALFDPFCQWAKWTQQDLGEEDPDLSVLINDFEPDDDSYTISLGAAECPAPVELNLAFIGTDLQLSYEPVCDFLSMVRPLILASAYLLAAYIYLGVLRG